MPLSGRVGRRGEGGEGEGTHESRDDRKPKRNQEQQLAQASRQGGCTSWGEGTPECLGPAARMYFVILGKPSRHPGGLVGRYTDMTSYHSLPPHPASMPSHPLAPARAYFLLLSRPHWKDARRWQRRRVQTMNAKHGEHRMGEQGLPVESGQRRRGSRRGGRGHSGRGCGRVGVSGRRCSPIIVYLLRVVVGALRWCRRRLGNADLDAVMREIKNLLGMCPMDEEGKKGEVART